MSPWAKTSMSGDLGSPNDIEELSILTKERVLPDKVLAGVKKNVDKREGAQPAFTSGVKRTVRPSSPEMDSATSQQRRRREWAGKPWAKRGKVQF